MIKVLLRGAEPGTFDLQSPNAEIVTDRRVMSVGKIAMVVSQS